MPSFSVTVRLLAVSPSRSAISEKKQLRSPVWHTLPAPWRSTLSRTVSWSQSVRIWRTARRFPDVSPFVQSVLRVRLKNVAEPVRRVMASASSFMNPTISTSPLAASCTTAGINPPSLPKSIIVVPQNTKAPPFPARLHDSSRRTPVRTTSCACLRRPARGAVMVMAVGAMDQVTHLRFQSSGSAERCQTDGC